MPIADQHWPSLTMWWPVSHHTRSAALQLVCCTRLTTVQVLSIFQFLILGGLPLGQSSPKGEMTYCPPRSTILQNFRPIAQTVYEIWVTKVIFHFLAPGGLTHGQKLTKSGDDLVDSRYFVHRLHDWAEILYDGRSRWVVGHLPFWRTLAQG